MIKFFIQVVYYFIGISLVGYFKIPADWAFIIGSLAVLIYDAVERTIAE